MEVVAEPYLLIVSFDFFSLTGRECNVMGRVDRAYNKCKNVLRDSTGKGKTNVKGGLIISSENEVGIASRTAEPLEKKLNKDSSQKQYYIIERVLVGRVDGEVGWRLYGSYIGLQVSDGSKRRVLILMEVAQVFANVRINMVRTCRGIRETSIVDKTAP